MEFHNLSAFIFLVIFLIFIYLVVVIPIRNVIIFRRISSHETWPILGNVVVMWKCHDEFNKLFENWVSKYGRGPAVVWGTYWFPIVVLGDARDVKKVLCSRDHVSKGLFYRALDIAIGTGAFNSPAGIWRQRRPHLEQAFHSKVLQLLPAIFDKCSRNLLDVLKKDGRDATGEIFDIHPYLNLCSIQMLVGGALGLDVDSFETDSKFWKLAVMNYSRGTYLAEYRMLRPWFLFLNTLWNLTTSSKEMQVAVGWLHCNLFSQFLAAKRRMDQENNNSKRADEKFYPKNFLETLLQLQSVKKELKLSDQELIYEIASIYIAGTDASGKTMSFVLLFLALNQKCQSKVAEELDTIFDGRCNQAITEVHCNQMRYLECCIKETLRLMPPVSFITRKLGSDIHLDKGECIPTGTEVVISTYAVHRNPEVYPEPNTFNPNRFLPQGMEPSKTADDKLPEIGPYDWIPFSAGPRNCLGPKFAMMEIKIVIANILRCYNVVTTPSMRMEDWILHTNITLNLEGGWNIGLIPRN